MPAAGHARRLALSNCSKELLSVPDLVQEEQGRAGQTVPVCHYLLDQYRNAGIAAVTVIRRPEKNDLGVYLASAECLDLEIDQLVVPSTAGSAHSLALGCERWPDSTIAIGFPDIIMRPSALCRDALAQLDSTGADVCLAHIPVPAEERDVWDKTYLDGDRVVGLTIKPDNAAYDRSWVMAVWRCEFSEFLVGWLADETNATRLDGEVALGHPLQAAIAEGLHVTASFAPHGFALDVGTPERLRVARAL